MEMCVGCYPRINHRKLAICSGLWSLFAASSIMAFSMTVLIIPYNRWLSVYRDLNADSLTDFGLVSSRLFTYHFAWTSRGSVFGCILTILTSHIVILAAGAR